MQVKEIMTSHVECVKPRDNLAFAAEKMRTADIGALPVCGDDDRLAGVLTDRDITVRGTAKGRDPAKTSVSDVMTPHVEYCFDDQEIEEAAKMMEEKGIRRVLVLNRDKRLVGIVSLGDLSVKGDQELSGEALEQISEAAPTK
jgi:CBS domain-containing protein